MAFDISNVEDIIMEWGEDFFGNAPLWDEPLGSGVWGDKKSDFGGIYMITLPVSYVQEDEDAIEWFDDLHPNIYRGDNNQDASDIQAEVNG